MILLCVAFSTILITSWHNALFINIVILSRNLLLKTFINIILLLYVLSPILKWNNLLHLYLKICFYHLVTYLLHYLNYKAMQFIFIIRDFYKKETHSKHVNSNIFSLLYGFLLNCYTNLTTIILSCLFIAFDILNTFFNFY